MTRTGSEGNREKGIMWKKKKVAELSEEEGLNLDMEIRQEQLPSFPQEIH